MAELRDEIEPAPAPELPPAAAVSEPAAPAPAPAPAPDDVDPLQKLLDEFDRAVPKPAPSAPGQPQPGLLNGPRDPLLPEPKFDHEFHQALSEVDRNIADQVNARFQTERARVDFIDDVEQWVAGQQARLPDYVPDDYYRSETIAAIATDPRIEIALNAIHNSVPQVAVRVELDKVNSALMSAATDPRLIPGLRQYKFQLETAFYARRILNQHDAAVAKKANSRKPIDVQVTEDREAVTAAMRGASRPHTAEPPPNLGRLSEQEFRQYKSQFGF